MLFQEFNKGLAMPLQGSSHDSTDAITLQITNHVNIAVIEIRFVSHLDNIAYIKRKSQYLQ